MKVNIYFYFDEKKDTLLILVSLQPFLNHLKNIMWIYLKGHKVNLTIILILTLYSCIFDD